jgi:hypothetical protein
VPKNQNGNSTVHHSARSLIGGGTRLLIAAPREPRELTDAPDFDPSGAAFATEPPTAWLLGATTMTSQLLDSDLMRDLLPCLPQCRW